jgi:hypothetical protein
VIPVTLSPPKIYSSRKNTNSRRIKPSSGISGISLKRPFNVPTVTALVQATQRVVDKVQGLGEIRVREVAKEIKKGKKGMIKVKVLAVVPIAEALE